MSPPSVDVATELRRLQVAYAAALPARADELELALGAWLDEADPRGRDSVHRIAHGLSGAGATYGMFELSALGRELARQVELSLEEPAGDGRLGLRALGAQVIEAMRAVRPFDAEGSEDSIAPARNTDRRRLVLLRTSDGTSDTLEPMLTAAGYRVLAVTMNEGVDLVQLVQKVAADVLLVDHALTLEPAGVELLRSLAERLTLGVYGSDGSFLPRLHAARLGAQIVLVPPFDDAALLELEAVLGLESEPAGRVLIIDDDSLVARSLSAVLEDEGLLTEVITNPELVLDKVDAFRPNLVLLDLNMPGVSGIEITRVIRQRADLVGTSVVFLSGETSWELQQQAMNAGADDFLLKPVEAERLTSSVRNRMRRFSRLDRRISRDGLTELMNQGTFKERVQVEVARARREDKPLSLALFDLDHFKAVNDTHGHGAGDRVLRAFAQLLRDTLRQTDALARCGGEEFGVLLPGATEAQAQGLMDQIRRAFNEVMHSSAFGEFRVTVSCGIAALPAAPDAPTLVDWADRALYRAKRSGRNQVALLPEEQRRGSSSRADTPRSLRRASSATTRSSSQGPPKPKP